MGPTRILLGERRDQETTNIKGYNGTRLCTAQMKSLGLPGFTLWIRAGIKGAEWFSPLCCSWKHPVGQILALWLCQGWGLGSVTGPSSVHADTWGKKGSSRGQGEGQSQLGSLDKPWLKIMNSGVASKARTPEHSQAPVLHLCSPVHSCTFVFKGLCDEVGSRLKSSWLVMHSGFK